MDSRWRVFAAAAALAWACGPAWGQTRPDTGDSPELREARERWRKTNEDVAKFPRGHVDLLQWESRNTAPTDEAPGTTQPLTADGAVQRALALHPEFFGPASANVLQAQDQLQALWELITDVRQAWFDAVLARQMRGIQGSRTTVAEQGAELGRRMVQAGNWSQARQQREQLTLAREQLALLQSRQAERMAIEGLAQRLGIGGSEDWAELQRALPTTLPEPPTQTGSLTASEAEKRVMDADAGLIRQRLETERTLMASPSGALAQLSIARDRALAGWSGDGLPTTLPSMADQRLARSESVREAAEAEAGWRQAESRRRSEARSAWGKVQEQRAMALHLQNVVLPLLTAQEQETQLRYNGMLQSTWDLLDATRERLGATSEVAQSRHAFWTAWLDWQLLAAGGPYRGSGTGAATNNTPSASPASKEH